jgi:hypothetical protein
MTTLATDSRKAVFWHGDLPPFDAEVIGEHTLEAVSGRYAHILHESIDSKHDDRVNEAWLHGRFAYVLYR